MKKQFPAVILILISVALAAALYSANQKIARLEEELAAAKSAPAETTESASVEITEPIEMVEAAAETTITAIQEPATEAVPEATVEESQESGGRRMMRNLAKMMENPSMNKMMEASQRGVIGAMYEDLIDYFDLSGEEEEYFMELLMFRQMTNVDAGMKMMSGNLSEEERQELEAQIKDAAELVKSEMSTFLNNEEDYAEFEFYEKTQGERMMLSQAEGKLNGTDDALSDETYRELLEIMHDERESFDFTSDLQDQENMDMGSERFSRENLDAFGNDLDQLNETIFEKTESVLTAEQFAAFKEAVITTTDLQKAQLEMAAQMFGGGN